MNSNRLVSLLAAVAMGLTFSTAGAGEVKWTGCGITKKAFMSEVAAAYEKKTGTAVKLSGGGATKGIRAVSAGTADLGGSCRHWLLEAAGEMHPEEKNANLIQVAWDALVIIVHPDNPVESITSEQLKQVYDGQITNWKELGGPDKRIVLVTREGKSSGVGHMARLLIFDDPNYEFKALSFKEKSTGPLEKKVEKTAAAMGLDGISSARKLKVKFLKVDGMEPSKENIGSGAYPLFRPLYLAINKTNPSPDAQAVVDFVLSPEGQAIVSRQGTVNLAEGAALQDKWNKKKAAMGL